MPPKRKATSPARSLPLKKVEKSDTKCLDESPTAEKMGKKEEKSDTKCLDESPMAEKMGIVQRQFYPPEMSNQRCEMYNNGKLSRPIDVLHQVIESTKTAREEVSAGDCVVHWFKRDLRLFDNRSLRMASEKAQQSKVPLVCMFIVSPQDYQAHFTSPARVDFELRTLEIMKKDLAELDIPLYVSTVEQRKKVTEHILMKCKEWGAKHLFCNIEYEVDELRREAKMITTGLETGIACTAVHDDVVVTPGHLRTGLGKQYSVYSPWYKAWLRHIHERPHLLSAAMKPERNSGDARERFQEEFDRPIPTAPENKSLTEEEKIRFAKLWPAGEHEAGRRLERFLQEKGGDYQKTRNFPALNSTAMLSVHFSAGTLAARTAVRSAQEANSTKKPGGGKEGLSGWISEVAWRDFYKHILAHWPYVCMFKPFKYEYSEMAWEYQEERFHKWCHGQTGFPIVDAAMRQLLHTGYMHNRCRMIVASFLTKDLLLDWRLGEKFFMEQLIDGDFASNNGGWGFCASTGVDPQPFFRIFNPILQSEKFDPTGQYLREWLPELRSLPLSNAIHHPYSRGLAQEARNAGYPSPMVVHSEARDLALARYKAVAKPAAVRL